MGRLKISTQTMAQVFLCLGVISLQLIGAFDGIGSLFIEKRAELAPRPASQDIVYVAIDRESLDQIGVWPWPRSAHAQVIEALVNAEVADIVFDVDFSNRSVPEEDQQLLDALRSAGGSVVLPTFVQQRSASSNKASSHTQTMPLTLFQDHSWMASVRVSPDSDGIVRSFHLGVELDEQLVPSWQDWLKAWASLENKRPSDDGLR